MRVFSNSQLIILVFLLLSITIILKSKTSGEGFTNDTMQEGDTLKPGYGLTSKNGKYRLDFGLDGTLKIIQVATDETNAIAMDTDSIKVTTLWDSGLTSTKTVTVLDFREGNLSVLDDTGNVRWDTKTKGAGGAGSKLVMGDDGVLTIYAADDTVIWSTPLLKPVSPSAISSPPPPPSPYALPSPSAISSPPPPLLEPNVGIKEGLMNVNLTDVEFTPRYKADITDKRALLQKKTDELVQLNNNTNKIGMDRAIFVNILATVAASSMIYYAVVG